MIGCELLSDREQHVTDIPDRSLASEGSPAWDTAYCVRTAAVHMAAPMPPGCKGDITVAQGSAAGGPKGVWNSANDG